MVAVSKGGKIVKRHRCDTTIPALVAAMEGVRRITAHICSFFDTTSY